MSENKFIDGLWVNKPHEKAPDFIKSEISIDLLRFVEWAKNWKLANPQEKYLKITIKESKKLEFYAEVNDWKPKEEPDPDYHESAGARDDDPGSDIPF